jgi:hypothetical protein
VQTLETVVTPASVKMVLADQLDREQATHIIEFVVPLAALRESSDRERRALGDPDLEYLLEIRRAALRYVRDAISVEIRRLGDQANRIS